MTASAAGLLTQIGIAPYAVSKHAEFFRRKSSGYDRWLAGMRRLRRSVEATIP